MVGGSTGYFRLHRECHDCIFMPKQVAHRMQGSGRGGRDGHKCVSIMFSDQEHLAWLQKVETHPRGTRHHSTSDQSPTLQCMLLIMQAGQV